MHLSESIRGSIGAFRRSTRSSELLKKQGPQSAKGYPFLGGFRTSQSRKFRPLFRWAKAGWLVGNSSPWSSFAHRPAIRLAIKPQPWVSKMAQIAPGLPENAVAFVSASALRLRHSRRRTSIWSPWVVSLSVPPRPHLLRLGQRIPLSPVPEPHLPLVCGPDRVALPGSSDALSRPGPSGDGPAAIPSVSDIPPGSNRVGC